MKIFERRATFFIKLKYRKADLAITLKNLHFPRKAFFKRLSSTNSEAKR